MTTKQAKTAMGLMLAGVLAGSAAWSAEAKTAVVDMGRVLKAFNETKAAESLLEKQKDEYEAEQKEMMAEREKLKKEFEVARDNARSKAISEKERESKLDIAEEKLNALRECEMKIRETTSSRQKELADQGMRMQRRIVTKLRGIIGKVAAEKQIDLVLDSAAVGISGVESVIYAGKALDITEDVIKVVNVGSETGDKRTAPADPKKDVKKTE